MSVAETLGTTSLAVVTRSQKTKLVQGCEGRGQWEGNGPATRVTRGPMSQYLPQHPESGPTQAPDRQPDEQTKDQKEDGEENLSHKCMHTLPQVMSSKLLHSS